MRALVTGASGMIGRAVCDALLARGDEVIGLSRDPDRARAANPAVEWHRWAPVTERPPQAALERVDAVINMVGETIDQRLSAEAKHRIRASRVPATANLVEAIGAAREAGGGPSVLVSQCAAGYYGDRGDAILDESAPPGNDWIARLCVEWEAAALAAQRDDVRTVVLRTAPVLEPSSGLLAQLLLPFRLGVGGPLAGGRWYLPWIHRDDAVALILWALGEPAVSGPLNAAAPNPVTNREFSRTLGRVLRRPAILPVPKLVIAALRGPELADAVTSSLRLVPRVALERGFRFRFEQLEPALRDLLGR